MAINIVDTKPITIRGVIPEASATSMKGTDLGDVRLYFYAGEQFPSAVEVFGRGTERLHREVFNLEQGSEMDRRFADNLNTRINTLLVALQGRNLIAYSTGEIVALPLENKPTNFIRDWVFGSKQEVVTDLHIQRGVHPHYQVKGFGKRAVEIPAEYFGIRLDRESGDSQKRGAPKATESALGGWVDDLQPFGRRWEKEDWPFLKAVYEWRGILDKPSPRQTQPDYENGVIKGRYPGKLEGDGPFEKSKDADLLAIDAVYEELGVDINLGDIAFWGVKVLKNPRNAFPVLSIIHPASEVEIPVFNRSNQGVIVPVEPGELLLA